MSNETKWTQGPWEYNPKTSQIFSRVKQQICKIWNFGGGEGKANAHLIAAVPELYEALDELADLMQGVIEGDYKPDSFTLQVAKAALAKARGESA